MKLLLTTDAVGGVWTYSLDLARGLARQDVEVVIAVLGPAPSPAALAEAAAIPGLRLIITALPLDWLASAPGEIARGGEALAALAAEERVDLVQLHAPAFAAAPFPVPVLTVVHSCMATWWEAVRGGALPAEFEWRAAQARAGLLRSDALVAPTAAFAAAVQRVYRLPAAPACVHNGRTPPSLAPTSQADVVLTVGRLWDEAKNVAGLDRAAAHLPIPAVAIGPTQGPEGSSIALTHLQTLGSVSSDMLAVRLAEQPIFVSTALYEPFGLSVLEAAQAGCALVLSDIPTFRELWDGAARFIDPRDDHAIAEAIIEVLNSPEQRQRLGEAARERSARYTVDATAAAMLARYRELLVGKVRRAA